MKRQLILTLSLLLFTLLLGFACEYGSYRVANDYQSDMLSIGMYLAQEDWESALRRTESIYADWQKECRIVQLWVNHTDIDHVTESLISLRASIIARDLPAALSAYGAGVENFGHLHHRDAFTLRNIL